MQEHVRHPAIVLVRRTFKAPPELVFRAFTDATMLSQWFARSPDTPPGIVIHHDPRPGGVYVVSFEWGLASGELVGRATAGVAVAR